MNIKKIIKNNLKLYIIMGIIILLGTIGIAFALVFSTFNPIDVDTIAGVLDAKIDYEGLSNTSFINSTNEMLPISDSIVDEAGINIDNPRVLKAEFNVSGVSSNPENTIYDVVLYGDLIDCDLRTEDLKWRLYKNDSLLSEGNLSPTFDIMKNDRLVLTNRQQPLTETPDKYTFILWISESCPGDLSECDANQDQSKYLNKTLNASLKVELSTKSTKELTRVTGEANSCKPNGTYTIKYDANGGTGAPEDQIKNHGESITLTNLEPTREGYTFEGWAASPYSDRAIYGPESSFAVNSNATLYAVWYAPTLKTSLVDGLDENYTCDPSTTECDATFLGSTIKRNQISSINFVDTISIPDGSSSFDVSEENNSSIMMWYTENSSGLYDVSIASTTGKILIKDASYLFSYLVNVETINFNNNVDTSNMTTLYRSFIYCSNLTNLDLSTFDTSNVINMATVFGECTSLITLDLSSWNTSNVTNMGTMFSQCRNLVTLHLNHFNTSKVTQMRGMFQACDNLTNIYINSWDTSKVTNMSYMFSSCINLTNLDISSWNTSNVTNMQAMFATCDSLTNLNLRNWDTSNVTDMSQMFYGSKNLTTIYVSDKWNTDSVLNSDYMFYQSASLIGGEGTAFNANIIDKTYARIDGGTTSPGYLTYKPANYYILMTSPEVTSDNDLFLRSNLKRNQIRTVTFVNNNRVPEGNTNVDISKEEDGSILMWYGNPTNNLYDIYIGSVNGKVAIENASHLFSSLINVTSIIFDNNIDTTNLTNMFAMFAACTKLTQINLSGFNTSNVTNMEALFQDCQNMTQLDLSKWNTSNVQHMAGIFIRCLALQNIDLSNFNTSNVTDMSYMFTGSKNLTTIYVSDKWNTDNVSNSTSMFINATSLIGGSGTTYDANYVDKTYARVDGGTSSPGYFTYKAASA